MTDEDIQRFICDGLLIIDSGLSASFHADVEAKLRFSVEKEFAMGNNTLPRIPEMYRVLDSVPIVRALTTLLGPDYVLHPHRAVHTNVPVENKDIDLSPEVNAPPMGKGSMAGSGWHQDAQSPLARARYHVPRHLILFYFPHDTDITAGPTRVEAGSYLFSRPEEPRHPILPDFVAAGTVFVLHFDLVHAGYSNLSEKTRYMVKFVASRTRNPETIPTTAPWSTPADIQTDYPLEPAWSAIWRWLHGLSHKPINQASQGDEGQIARLNRIYSANCDEKQIARWIAELVSSRGHDRHLRKLRIADSGTPLPIDRPTNDLRWNERAIVMEDAAYALAMADGKAVEPICDLFALADPWVSINACFALGEIGAAAAIPTLLEALDDPHQQVVRQALDALGVLGHAINEALPAIESLLVRDNDAWQEPEVMRGWTAQDQIRLNAVFALLNVIHLDDTDLQTVEHILINALDDANCYVPEVACEALRRIDTPTAITAAFKHLQQRRWDPSLRGRQKLY